ncbi:MAG: helix-turn-helix transcriptional regulator [Bdellovibrionota bacterium]
MRNQFPSKLQRINRRSTRAEYELGLVLNYFGEALKHCRAKMGLTQTEMSELLDMPICHISRLEKGSLDFRLSTLLRIATLMGICLPKRLLGTQELKIESRRVGGWALGRKGRGVLKNNNKINGLQKFD